eukprot:scaffold21569_cov107-Isochrysis_galbana.AAC.1
MRARLLVGHIWQRRDEGGEENQKDSPHDGGRSDGGGSCSTGAGGPRIDWHSKNRLPGWGAAGRAVRE